MTSLVRPGFQGSENSGVEVLIYSQDGNDPIILNGGVLSMAGRRREDADPCLINVQTTKAFGAPSGSFVVAAKPSRGVTESMFERILDDDWIDIVFSRHGRRYHTMRGLIDEVREEEVVTSSGATTTAYMITGRDFGKVWEKTQIWFNPYSAENVGGGISMKVFSNARNVGGNVATVVQAFLRGFLEALGDLGRASWIPPQNMPNVGASFLESVVFSVDGYTDTPARTSINANFMMPQGNAWSLAQEWSDPIFCELFCDLYGGGEPTEEAPIDTTHMTVVLRDRPFPTTALRENSPWFRLPMYVVPRQSITVSNVGRSGLERYNAYFVAPQLTQETVRAGALDLLQPLWNRQDIDLHGMQRFDVTSRYTSPSAEFLTMARSQREMVRDWYCMNPYLLNGTLNLGVGRPDIRVGTRIRVPSPISEAYDRTYYCESVTNNWQPGRGTKTTLGVTRGWVGTDNAYLAALDAVAARYEIPSAAEPGASV